MSKLIAHMTARAGQAAGCEVCGGDIRSPATLLAAAELVCESAHCRALISRRGTISPDAFRFQVEILRRQRREQLERSAAEQRLRAERRAREAREHEAIRAAMADEERRSTASYPLVVLPSGPQGLEALSTGRREQYREHLDTVIAEAVAASGADAAEVPPQVPSTAEPIPLAERFCTLCRGGCCSMGADKAYLTAATIRRFMRLRPDLRPDQIAAEYLARLSRETIRGSCVNHSATGCSLPREMRADTCNEYFCPSLREWQKRCAAGDRPLGAFVIQRRQDNWRRELPEATNDVVGVSIVADHGTRSIWTGP